ncbi:MAG TPA: hypothetical protein VF363_07430 [Candidatus Eisenbacteria bacterium]
MKRRRRATPSIRVFPNDPDASVGLVPATPAAPREGEPAFVIEGRRYAPAPYDPGTLSFQYWQGETALERTIGVWEDLFDRDFSAWHGDRPLRVRLRAGRDLNAFYDRKSLQFFYDTDRVTGRVVYAAESLDVVAHEAGHAVLDVYQPGFWATPDPETAAFHEAFGDCSALLVTLTDLSVRRGFLAETGGRYATSNLVSRLAEALGRAIHDNYGPGAVSDPTRLRDANNSFRYAPAEKLPADAPDDRLASEPHSFSRVFTGAFYDLLTRLVARELREEPRDPDASVERGRRLAGRLLARAVETMPPGEARYRAVAVRMREVDQTEEGGVASIAIEEAFAAHGIRLPSIAARGRKGRSAYRALRALDPDRPGGTGAIRAALGLGPGARFARASWKRRTGGGTREQLIHRTTVAVPLEVGGRIRPVRVAVICGCTLTRDPAGEVEGVSLRPHRHPTAAETARRLRPWVKRGEIARGRPRPSAEHFRDRTPFRIGRSGILERVYFD